MGLSSAPESAGIWGLVLEFRVCLWDLVLELGVWLWDLGSGAGIEGLALEFGV